jgi:methionine sulfoxide reductase heme-binding subunit
MSVTYSGISWNPQKRTYDLVMVAFAVAYLGLFSGLSLWLNPNITAETLLIRAFGTLSFLLLHLVLLIGPLCRLDSRLLPLLYNRRHLGVTTFLVALVHGSLSLFQFHAFGDVNPLVSLLTTNTRFGSLSGFPFQLLGFVALVILFLMAATSHDFWLANLSAPIWKKLHMLVYFAYALLVAHVILGVLQSETNPVLVITLVAGVASVLSVHLAAAVRERRVDQNQSGESGLVPVCRVEDIPERRACVATLNGERVAVFKYDGKVAAVSNVCQHQNGPLGEGKIIDGCITCPWHGFQYLPETGASPPPFEERVPTFRVVIHDGMVLVDPRPIEPGMLTEPARIEPGSSDGG